MKLTTKEYTVGDMVTHNLNRIELDNRSKEQVIIDEVRDRQRFINSRFYYHQSREKKKKLRAESDTILLSAWR